MIGGKKFAKEREEGIVAEDLVNKLSKTIGYDVITAEARAYNIFIFFFYVFSHILFPYRRHIFILYGSIVS